MKWKTLGIIVLLVLYTLFFGTTLAILCKAHKIEQHQKQMVAQLNQDLQKGKGE